ncbi:MAG: hypothetical protein ACTHNW_16320 [Mucilaginibacter sp.]
MKQQEVFKKIGGIIKELSDQYEYLKTADEPLNDLELELFLANSNFLTDHMLILSKLNAQAAAAKKEAEREMKKPEPEPEQPKKVLPPELPKHTEEPRYFEPLVQSPPILLPVDDIVVPEIRLEENVQPEPEIIDITEIHPVNYEESGTIRHELIIDEADLDDEDDILPEPAVKEKTAEVKPEPEPIPVIAKEEPVPVKEEKPEPKPAPQPAKEPVKEEVQTINERMSARFSERNGMADHLNTQPISDLKAAINLNDKLLYVKDLFNGYSLAYSEAIEILNRFSSFDEADLFLKKNYVAKNNWEGKPETTAKFYEILKRRYV